MQDLAERGKSLKPWCRIYSEADRLTFFSGDATVTLKGRAAESLYPRLLPLLNGCRTIAEIENLFEGDERRLVAPAIALLDRQNLLIAGESPAADTELARSAVFVAAIEGAGTPKAIGERLREAHVAVFGASGIAAEITRGLRASGVAAEQHEDLRAFESTGSQTAVVAPSNAQLRLLHALNEHALRYGKPWMLVAPYDGRLASVGPLFIPGETACYACYVLRRASNVEHPNDYLAFDKAQAPFEQCAALDVTLAGLATMTMIRWIGGNDPTAVSAMLAVTPLRDRITSTHEVLRVPRCPACSESWNAAPPSPWHDA
jgi:bacteriocin biosynthesis cyclodehydratase domain-containing protein